MAVLQPSRRFLPAMIAACLCGPALAQTAPGEADQRGDVAEAFVSPTPEEDMAAAESAGVIFASIRAPSVMELRRSADEGKPLSCDSRLGLLMDDPAARTVLERHIPDVISSPKIAKARGLTLTQLAGFRQSGITPETLTQIAQDLASAR